ncbi:hypothetical protein GCM10008937_15660 [Deinococcus depolymerans]|uniref:Two-component sensor histidine kinase n=1 Tax=Deinococcus depolymerans TaxID=392408 RepID=A0ABP3LWI5_9DEIO
MRHAAPPPVPVREGSAARRVRVLRVLRLAPLRRLFAVLIFALTVITVTLLAAAFIDRAGEAAA